MFQQGSSDWCIMTTLRKTPENRLSISKTTLITTVLEQNSSVKQCCSYFSFTLSTSNGLHRNTLDFQEYKEWGLQTLPRNLVQLNTAEAKLASFAHKHGWFTLPQKGRRLPRQGFRSFCRANCPWHSHPQPPAPLRAEEMMLNNQELPNISCYKLHSVWPTWNPSPGFLNGI